MKMTSKKPKGVGYKKEPGFRSRPDKQRLDVPKDYESIDGGMEKLFWWVVIATILFGLIGFLMRINR